MFANLNQVGQVYNGVGETTFLAPKAHIADEVGTPLERCVFICAVGARPPLPHRANHKRRSITLTTSQINRNIYQVFFVSLYDNKK